MTGPTYGPQRPTDADLDWLRQELDQAENEAATTFAAWGSTPAEIAATNDRAAAATEGLISALRISMEHPEPEPEAGA
jgi:hypothetical protein